MVKIVHNKWETLCEYKFKEPEHNIPQKDCLIYVQPDWMPEFFSRIEGSRYKYTLVSANSDFCLVNQEQYPVSEDMTKWLRMLGTGMMKVDGYEPMIIPPRCKTEKCKLTDKFSLKCDTYTNATFNRIPDNVRHIFMSNCNLDHPKITHIPFGIAEWSVDYLSEMRIVSERVPKVYVNMASNNMVRHDVKELLSKQPWCVVKDNVSKEEYFEDLKTYKYCLSLPGNGLDCYRTLEALYAGATPVLLNEKFNSPYRGTGAVFIDSIYEAAIENLESINPDSSQKEKIYLDYWQEQIKTRLQIVSI